MYEMAGECVICLKLCSSHFLEVNDSNRLIEQNWQTSRDIRTYVELTNSDRLNS